jgi:diadenosine tetraphosphatase ApaH/serine/threonine PP2A family protein phosphatase
MRYLVLSDIHANLEALEATLEAGSGADAVLVLGDLVGYGADPNAVVERVRELQDAVMVRGNHDKVGAGIESVRGFNHLARQAIEWTAAALQPDHRRWLAELPRGPVDIVDGLRICHGSPLDEDDYLFDELDARRALGAIQSGVCLFGHTHVPTAFRANGGFEVIGPPRGSRFEIAFDPGWRYLVNCGAVGQPRDGDYRAAFGLLDTTAGRLVIQRVPYDVETAQAKIIAAGLPEVLAQRLAIGR